MSKISDLTPAPSTKVLSRRLMIVGNGLPFHVGHHFLGAACKLGLKVTMCDTRAASSNSQLVQAIYWRLGGRKQVHQRAFGYNLIERCHREQPDLLLATGIAPIDRSTLKVLDQQGIECANFLTDDPWNPAHFAPWFLAALPHYHYVFTPRLANLEDLRTIGCRNVDYLPFAYNPDVHYREPLCEASATVTADIMFAGGADPNRMPWIVKLIDAGFNIALYGNYWERHRITRHYARGQADLTMLRKAVATARVNLCLVRRANRDGHVMRTFEVPAMGGCMLTEYTEEHQRILGNDGAAVLYFRSLQEMVDKLRWLLEHDNERQRLNKAVHVRITQGKHTYQDRLIEILGRISQ